MASSALRRSLLPRGSFLLELRSNPPPCAAAPAGGTFHRSFASWADETPEQGEERLFGNNGSGEGSFFRKLDKAESASKKYGMGSGMGAFGGFDNWGMGGFDSLNDGMSGKLDDFARTFQANDDKEEDWRDDFEFRPDVQFRRGSTYKVRELDLTRRAAPRNPPRPQFETTTKEVLKRADFRNVRFLSNFITEAGIIIKRSQTRISAKAQRKVAREIKTARAFGLMPFTTMGRKPFVFGRSAEVHHSDEEYGYTFVQDGDEDNEDAGAAVDSA